MIMFEESAERSGTVFFSGRGKFMMVLCRISRSQKRKKNRKLEEFEDHNEAETSEEG